jgi:hypothetical protein
MRIRKASALHEGLRKHFLPRNDSGPIDVSEDTLSVFTECMLTILAWLTNYSAARRSLPREFIGHWNDERSTMQRSQGGVVQQLRVFPNLVRSIGYGIGDRATSFIHPDRCSLLLIELAKLLTHLPSYLIYLQKTSSDLFLVIHILSLQLYKITHGRLTKSEEQLS